MKKIQYELRVGYVTKLYDEVRKLPSKKQLDLLEEWFPSLIIHEIDNPKQEKKEPEYDDLNRIIHAYKYRDSFYSSGSARVTQIVGRLIGTSNSNQEKERKTTELIQKQISHFLVEDMEYIADYLGMLQEKMDALSEKEYENFYHVLFGFALQCALHQYEKDSYDRESELYAFDEETFDQIIYNVVFQLIHNAESGITNAYAWLLFGSLLRNQCGRLTRTYDSYWQPIYKSSGETMDLFDRLDYLLQPEVYEHYYVGEKENRFPDIAWYCDHCGDYLNLQDGFDDRLKAWQCRKCGCINSLSWDEVYESEEDYKHKIKRKNHSTFPKAIKKK